MILDPIITEPYIALSGPNAGQLSWFEVDRGEPCLRMGDMDNDWAPYADFEREVLVRLDAEMEQVGISGRDGYFLQTDEAYHCSRHLTGFNGLDYADAAESDRILERAEFLRAVCEEEAVTWLPAKPGNCDKCGSEDTRLDFRFGCTPGLSFSAIECRDCGHQEDHPLHMQKQSESGGKVLGDPAADASGTTTACAGEDSTERRGRKITMAEACKIAREMCESADRAFAAEAERESAYHDALRDSYTRAEVDERMRALLDAMDDVFSAIKKAHHNPTVNWSYSLDGLRKRFLP